MYKQPVQIEIILNSEEMDMHIVLVIAELDNAMHLILYLEC